MEKDYNPATGIFSSTFTLEQDCEYKGKMYSSMRQLLLCITACLEIISVHDRELQDLSPACKSFPTPSSYEEFFLHGFLCYRSSFVLCFPSPGHRHTGMLQLCRAQCSSPGDGGCAVQVSAPRHGDEAVLVAVASKRLFSQLAVTQGKGRPKVFMAICTLFIIDFFIYLFT